MGRLARAFLAKAVLDVPTTRGLVERLRTEPTLRRLCGWEAAGGVPSEATFSRAFAEFAASDLPGHLHEALLDRTLKGHLAGHVSRDSTAIGGRESPAPKPAPTAKPKHHGVGRARPKEPRRLQRQPSMTLEQMLEDLPKVCDIGVKRNPRDSGDLQTSTRSTVAFRSCLSASVQAGGLTASRSTALRDQRRSGAKSRPSTSIPAGGRR